MRRLAPRLPALSFHFHLAPEQVAVMPSYLLDEYLTALDDIEQFLSRRAQGR